MSTTPRPLHDDSVADQKIPEAKRKAIGSAIKACCGLPDTNDEDVFVLLTAAAAAARSALLDAKPDSHERLEELAGRGRAIGKRFRNGPNPNPSPAQLKADLEEANAEIARLKAAAAKG